jgi:hypothetical protein
MSVQPTIAPLPGDNFSAGHADSACALAVRLPVADVGCAVRLDAEPLERPLEDRRLRLGCAGFGGREDGLEEAVEPNLGELFLQADVPVRDAGEREARGADPLEGWDGAVDGREDHGVDEGGRELGWVDVCVDPLQEDCGAPLTEIGEPGCVVSLELVPEVVGDLALECSADLAERTVDLPTA